MEKLRVCQVSNIDAWSTLAKEAIPFLANGRAVYDNFTIEVIDADGSERYTLFEAGSFKTLGYLVLTVENVTAHRGDGAMSTFEWSY